MKYDRLFAMIFLYKKNKKASGISIVFLLLLFLSAAKTHAKTGIGIQGGFDFSTEPAFFVSVTGRSDQYPWVISLNSFPQKNMISVFADDYFVNECFENTDIEYYLFWGISAGFMSDDGVIEASTGCRFGAGMDFFCSHRQMSFFLKTAWSPYFGAKKDDGKWRPLVRPVSFPCSAGLRFWF